MSGPTALADLIALFRGGQDPAPKPAQHDKSSSPRAHGPWTTWQDAQGRWWARRHSEGPESGRKQAAEPSGEIMAALGMAKDAAPPRGALAAVFGEALETTRIADGFEVLARSHWRVSVAVLHATNAPSEARGRENPGWSLPPVDLLLIVGVAPWLDRVRVGHIAEACIARRSRTTMVFGALGTGADEWTRLAGVIRDQGAQVQIGAAAKRGGW